MEYGSFEYNTGPDQERVVMLPGDGRLHSIVVSDNESAECNGLISLVTLDCSPEICAGLQVDFEIEVNYIENSVSLTNKSSGSLKETIWDFGDGNISTAQNPTHQYQDTGSFAICLSIVDEDNCSEMKCQEIELDNNICEVSFSYQKIGSQHTFINTSKVALSNYDFEWSFGDGNTIPNEDTIQHVFSVGIFEVCLTTDAGSCISSYCETFDFSDACSPFTSDFQFEINPNNHQSVIFSDQTTGNPDSWLWGFGDGATSRDSSPTYDYEFPGTYNVCLLVGNSEDNCLSSTCQEIHIISSSIEESSNQGRILISPNPQSVGQSFVISLENIYTSSEEVNVIVYSIEGQKMFQEHIELNDELTIPIRLDSGVYFVKMVLGSKAYTTRLVLF
jgi:PKD repeat protein